MAGACLLGAALASPQLSSEGPDEGAVYQHPLYWLSPQPVGFAALAAANFTSTPWRRSTWARPAAVAPRFLLGLSRPSAPAPLGASRPLSPWNNASPGWGEFFKWMIVAAMLEIGHGMKNMLGYFLAMYVVMKIMD